MDRLDHIEFASVVTAITNAFGDPTRRDIYLFVQGSEGGATAAEVAQRFDLHANVARHHLDKLCAGGYLEMSTDRSVGGAGRPSKRYRTDQNLATINVPVRQDDLLVKLLGRSLSELGPERAASVAHDVGVEYGRAMAEAMGDQSPRSFRSALQSVADALASHGFATHAQKTGGSLELVTEHCPFGAAAVEHPVICAMDRGMVEGMLGLLYGETSVDLIPAHDGDRLCVTAFADEA